MKRDFFGLAAVLLLAAPVGFAESETVDFGRQIRPILSDTCFLCHGPAEDMRQADLRLDDRSVAVKAGAIVPGNPDESELIARLTSDDPEYRMPPADSGKSISKAQIELLRQWIKENAEYSDHWAFIAPKRPDVPKVKNDAWPKNPIDHFVLAKLEANGLVPSKPVDATTLIRRLYLDLIGLPPSPQQVDELLSSIDEQSYDRLVERLLESRHFGEHWGRWWLDAARYADSDGYEKDKQRSVWFYRDWVIDAMNSDKPYDEFIIEQISGDLLPGAGQSEIVATGFLRNSMVNEEGGADPEQFRVEGMFDRVDAIGKAILGVTTQCGQCHNHKYDPLSQREYYRMFAALNDFHEATKTVYTPSQQRKRREIEQGVARIEEELKRKLPDWESRLARWEEQARARLIDWRTVAPTDRPWEGQKFRPLPDGSIISESYAPTKTSNTFSLKTSAHKITAFRLDALTHPQLPRGGPGRSIYGTGALTEFEVAVTPVDNPKAKKTIKFARAIADVNAERSLLPGAYRNRDPGKDKRVTGPIGYAIDGDHNTAWTTDAGPGRRNINRYAVFVPTEPITMDGQFTLSFTLRQLHGGWNSDDNQNYLLGRYRFSITDNEQIPETAIPAWVEEILCVPGEKRTPDQQDRLFSYWRTTVPEAAQENAEIEKLWQSYPETDTQLVAYGMGKPRPTHVMTKGNFLSPAERVEPGAPNFLNPMPESDEPPRLRFARWLVADDSPTTARVIVNRMWQQYFGRALVATPEDFGYQSVPPTHPKLLDWLAVELMENNWSLKHIHRLIVGSATYRQSSVISDTLQQADPYNELLARGPRYRVNAETVRDVALAVSGLLNRKVGGPSVYPPAPNFLFQPPASYGPKNWYTSEGSEQYRRSLYVHAYRSVPYPPLQVFDAPKGDAACVRRTRSNTPLQALVVLNEPQYVECARAMAGRVLREAGDGDEQRLCYAFRLCVSRTPQANELEILKRLLTQQRQRIEKKEIDVEALIGTSRNHYKQMTGEDADDYAPWIVVCRALLNLDETITKQ